MQLDLKKHIPIELIGKICSFLELREVKPIVYSTTRDSAATIRSEYMKGSLYLLEKINDMSCWERRRECTECWMKYNEWRGLKSSHHALQPFMDIIKSVERGILPIIQYLIEDKKMDVNTTSIIDNGHFEVSVCPLSIALQVPDVSVLKYLLQVPNINVNAAFQTTFRNSVLHYAAGDPTISYEHFLLLLSHANIQVNIRDTMGKTPLHYCCWLLPPDYERKVQSLIKCGSNVNAIGFDQQDPLQVVTSAGLRKRKNVDGVEYLLREAGAIEVIVGP